MKSKPWIAIDLFTHQVLGNYTSEIEAALAWPSTAVVAQYAPNAREVK